MDSSTRWLVIILIICAAFGVAGRDFQKTLSGAVSAYLPQRQQADVQPKAQTLPTLREDTQYYYVTASEMQAVNEIIYQSMENGRPSNVRLSDGTVIRVDYQFRGYCPHNGRPLYSAQTSKPVVVKP